MSFASSLESGRFAVALEITPPQRPLPAVLLRRARLLGSTPDAINVIQRPDRQSSLDASLALQQSGIEPVWHLVTRGRSRAEIAADMDAAHAGGVTSLLCLRGDHTAEDAPDTPTIRDAVAMALQHMPGALVGATLNQYAADPARELRNLLPKLRAGARYAQTQPVFDAAHLRPLAAPVKEAAPDTRIVAMAMPLVSDDAVSRIERRLNIALPDQVHRRVGGGEASAWEFFTATLAALVQDPLIDGVAIMTFEMDAPEGMGDRILAALRSAGADQD
jgi:homocysteine S-methyltransferase